MITTSNSSVKEERAAPSITRCSAAHHCLFRACPRANRTFSLARNRIPCATSSTNQSQVAAPWRPWRSSGPGAWKIILQQQAQNVLCILAIGLLLAFSLPSDLAGVPDPQLEVQFRQESLEPARMSTGFHAHTHRRSLGRQLTVELLRRLTVLQSTLPAIPSFTIDKRNLLEARMIITPYNNHVGSFLPGLGWFAPPKSVRAWEPTLLWNQLHSFAETTGGVSS